MRLSASVIDSEVNNTLTMNLKDRVLWDSSVPGFGARITPKGTVSFILQYRFQGQLRKLTMAKYGRVTLTQARDQARVYFGEIMKGADPALRKKETKMGSSVADLCRVYLQRHAPKKETGAEDRQKIESRIVPEFGKRKLASITYQDMVRFHQNYGAPVQANRCLSLLSKMFNLAKDWGLLPHSHVNPCNGIKKNPEKARSRYITDSEMPKLMAAINAYPNQHLKGALLICLFTGIRQKSVMSLKWSDIDFDGATLKERKSKTSKAGEVVVHQLTSAAIEVFRTIPRHAKDLHIFTNGFKRKTQTTYLWEAWDEIKKQVGIQETEDDKLWLHDLRRTLGSWLVKNNYSTNVAKVALNHKSLVAAQRYQHISDGDLVRNALEDVTQKMLKGFP